MKEENNYMCDNCGEGFSKEEITISEKEDYSLCEFCCPQCYGELK
jgi:predicted sulfurtransferase|tara:strand:- start:134 stop:268 length:135 start_codon:yes stop_codon:yes gene_type:complete